MFTYSPRRIRLTSPFIHENTGQSAPFNIKEKKKWVSRFHLAGSSLCATAVALVFWGSTQQLAPLPFAALALASATILSYGIEMFSAGKADETLIRSSLSDKIFPPSGLWGAKTQQTDISPSFFVLRKLRDDTPIKPQLRRNLFLG